MEKMTKANIFSPLCCDVSSHQHANLSCDREAECWSELRTGIEIWWFCRSAEQPLWSIMSVEPVTHRYPTVAILDFGSHTVNPDTEIH